MAIITSRTRDAAKLVIDTEKCIGCGLCVKVCKDFGLVLENGKARQSASPLFGCLACGHCMAVCPQSAIQVIGRELSSDDLIDMPEEDETADYESLFKLLKRRRSIREYSDKPVSKGVTTKILQAALTAPMGLPPSDVNVLIMDTKEKVFSFSKDFCGFLKEIRWMYSSFFITVMRPFWGKKADDVFRNFVRPAAKAYISKMEKDEDIVLYAAPQVMYFYGTPYCDPADPIIAATYAMLAAESLGLGTCMLGAIHPLIQNGSAAARFRKKHGIRHKSREGLFIAMGYPDIKYQKGLKRTFANIDYF